MNINEKFKEDAPFIPAPPIAKDGMLLLALVVWEGRAGSDSLPPLPHSHLGTKLGSNAGGRISGHPLPFLLLSSYARSSHERAVQERTPRQWPLHRSKEGDSSPLYLQLGWWLFPRRWASSQEKAASSGTLLDSEVEQIPKAESKNQMVNKGSSRPALTQ